MNTTRCSITLFLLAVVFEASGMIIPIEGHARLTVLLASDTMVVATKEVSGAEQDEVFALDGRTRKVRWRINSKGVMNVAVADATNAFYMFADNHLQKRNLQTGMLVWSTRLDSIPQQKTPPRITIKDRWNNLLDKTPLARSSKPVAVKIPSFVFPPNYYTYTPTVSGSTLALFRKAEHSVGCIVTPCFSDWIVFDRKTGRQISGGSGDLLGEEGETAVFEDQSAIWALKNGRMVEVNFPQRTGVYTVRGWPRSGRNEQSNRNGRFIFSQIDGGLEQTCVFDIAKLDVVAFSASVLSEFQVNWVVLDEHLLRYSECMAFSENGTRSGHPWFELYNLKGEFIARRESKSADETWYLTWLGITKSGKVLFGNGDERVAVETPSLDLTSFVVPREPKPSANEGGAYTSSYMPRGANCFYITHGNTWIRQMPREEVPHELRLSAVDAESNEPIWEHVEHVTIKKITNR